MSAEVILEVKEVSKEFPGVKALQNVTFNVKKGTVHAFMGENGAGKSTLMKIIIGLYSPTSGTVYFKGKPLKQGDIGSALERGISMIHQELSPVPQMKVAENIFLGREPTFGKTGWVNRKALIKKTQDLFDRLEIHINPKAKMIDLSIANTQLVEIAKAISFDSSLIIMDEPTSAISDKEVEHLFKIIRSLKKNGVAMIYITHKMEELHQIADEVTVLRDGQYIGTDPIEKVTKDRLITMMVGRELNQVFSHKESEIKEIALSVKGLTRKGHFENVSFNVRKGEVLGIAGLMGSGRTEVLEAVFGITRIDSGEIEVNGKQVKINSPRDAIKNRIGLLTEDRKLTGCLLPLNVQDNMILVHIDHYAKGGLLNRKQIKQDCETQRTSLNIKTPSIDQIIKNLSGGNQQKVLLARWLLNNPDILLLDEPTRGIDVGAKSEIYNLIFDLSKQGKAVIVVSSEMPEILGLSDRIVVMSEGQLTGELKKEEATQEKIMQLASLAVAENV
jgi:inositol transport system ATP-binding protein